MRPLPTKLYNQVKEMINKSAGNDEKAQPNQKTSSVPVAINNTDSINTNCVSGDGSDCEICSSKSIVRLEKRWMLIWTGIMALSSSIAVGVGCLQWSAMSDQRKIMDDQRKIMSDQSRVMSDQLNEMKGAGEQTNKLIKIATNQAIATGNLAETSRNNLQEIKRQFEGVQRAYVIPEIRETNFEKIRAGVLKVNVAFPNFGRSPAINGIGSGKIFAGLDAMKSAKEWFDSENTLLCSAGVIIPPEATLRTYTSLHSDFEFDEDSMAQAKGINDGIVVVYREVYCDMFGGNYRTDVCFTRLKTGAIANCASNNEVH